MIWRWAICFSRPEADGRLVAWKKPLFVLVGRLLLLGSLPLISTRVFSATLTGRVELRDSRDPAVRKRLDYSGVVISLKPLQVGVAVEHHPAESHAAQSQESKATMLQKDKTFSPHVLAIPVGASVDFPNVDPIFHNAFSSYNGQMFDVGLYPPGSSRKVRFTREGVVRVFCNIHASMSAVIVVLGTPYFATTRQNGSFEIPDVPPGEYQLNVFHEHATEATLRALDRRLVVQDDNVTLPALTISEAGFLPIPHKNKYGQDYPAEPDDHSIYPAVRK